MERKQNLYKKIGGGYLWISIGGKIRKIKSGEEFYASPDEVKNFLDVLEMIEVKKTKENKTIEKKYSIVEIEGQKGLYNIVDKNGKIINEKPLIKMNALKLIKTLE